MAEFSGTGLTVQRIARSQPLRPYPHFTSITGSLPIGYSWYHSMQVNVDKRLAQGLLFQTGRTGSFGSPELMDDQKTERWRLEDQGLTALLRSIGSKIMWSKIFASPCYKAAPELDTT